MVTSDVNADRAKSGARFTCNAAYSTLLLCRLFFQLVEEGAPTDSVVRVISAPIHSIYIFSYFFFSSTKTLSIVLPNFT